MMKYALSLTLRESAVDQMLHVHCLVLASDAIWEMLYEGDTHPQLLDVCDVLSSIVNAIKRGYTTKCNNLHLSQHCIRLVHVLGRLMTTEDERSSIRQHVDALVRTGYRAARNGDSFLHTAVRQASSLFSDARVLHVASRLAVELLLEAGAPVNAVNHKGDTPLHLAVFSQPAIMRGDDKDWSEIIDALLKHGAHVDMANKVGKTVQDFLPADVVFKHTSLACLAARAVRASELPYRGILPTRLADFVDEH